MTNIEKKDLLQKSKENARKELDRVKKEENPCHIMTRITIKDLELQIKAFEKEIENLEKKINKKI